GREGRVGGGRPRDRDSGRSDRACVRAVLPRRSLAVSHPGWRASGGCGTRLVDRALDRGGAWRDDPDFIPVGTGDPGDGIASARRRGERGVIVVTGRGR